MLSEMLSKKAGSRKEEGREEGKKLSLYLESFSGARFSVFGNRVTGFGAVD